MFIFPVLFLERLPSKESSNFSQIYYKSAKLLSMRVKRKQNWTKKKPTSAVVTGCYSYHGGQETLMKEEKSSRHFD